MRAAAVSVVDSELIPASDCRFVSSTCETQSHLSSPAPCSVHANASCCFPSSFLLPRSRCWTQRPLHCTIATSVSPRAAAQSIDRANAGAFLHRRGNIAATRQAHDDANGAEAAWKQCSAPILPPSRASLTPPLRDHCSRSAGLLPSFRRRSTCDSMSGRQLPAGIAVLL